MDMIILYRGVNKLSLVDWYSMYVCFLVLIEFWLELNFDRGRVFLFKFGYVIWENVLINDMRNMNK